jgi:hypothetical protein
MAAAALDHPNVCTVYEIDEADGKRSLRWPYLNTIRNPDELRSWANPHLHAAGFPGRLAVLA